MLNKIYYLLLFCSLFCITSISCSSQDSLSTVEPDVDDSIFQLPNSSYVLAEQAKNAVIIVDQKTSKVIWRWDAQSSSISSDHYSWFINPSEAKPVYNNKYILMTASGGAVALIRISDKKVMFYANCGANPHSAEILPDGNIVTAESRNGEINTFIVDTLKVLGSKSHTLRLGNAHNVVWHKKRDCLYASATIQSGVTALFKFNYNHDSINPQLINQQRIYTFESESGGHDLFPVFGETDKLWFSAASAVYQFDVSESPINCSKVYDIPDIKSVSNGPNGIVMLRPTESWWAEGLINEKGEALFQMQGAQIYKGRWMLDNTFSYPNKHDFHLFTN